VRFDVAIDQFIADMRAQARINSDHTETAYRTALTQHAEDVANRDPAKTGREDVKRTLAHWRHPNSRNQRHAILRSFYDWCMEEGHRRDNPARQVRKARASKPQMYRLTRGETLALLDASKQDRRDRWVAYLGILAGLRSQELRGLQGRHLQRDGWVWVSPDIGKGRVERWVPVLAELDPVVAEIRALVAIDGFVFPGQRRADPPHGTRMVDTNRPQSASALHRRVVRLGQAAGIAGRVTPHSLRHAFGDLIARHAGARVAQVLMGHASIETTVGTYLGAVSLDEIALAVAGLRIDAPELPVAVHPDKPSAHDRST